MLTVLDSLDSLLSFASPILAFLLPLAGAVVSILKLVYLYREAQLFRSCTEENPSPEF